jgi:class 3 adenylate cyclase
VFCDLAGSTALGERLDPEVLRSVQERYFAAAAGALRAHGGQVEKYIGDAVMCVFGLPAANEDDALRAVRGALDLAAGVEQLNVALLAELEIELAVRVGVNTGEVVAGDHTTGQALVTGDTVNTAARLEQAAPVGGILIGELTHRLVAHAVLAEPADPVSAKGKSEPVPAWRLLGIAGTSAGLAGRAGYLVGRGEELAALQARLERVQRCCQTELVVVSGDAGIGKSALVATFAADLAEDRMLYGACPSYGGGATYRPLRDMLDALVPALPEQSLVRVLAGEPEATTVAQRLVRLAGYESGHVARESGFGAVARLLGAVAAGRPLVVVVEDLHWAEETFLDLLAFLAESLAAPVLLVGTARDVLFEERPELAEGALRLRPLGMDAAAELLARRHAMSAEEAARVIARADGNPLFLEQLGAALEEGSASVPADIAGLIAARVDRLDAQARSALEAASIIGRDFWPGALVPLLDHEYEVRSLEATLEELEARELVGSGASGALAGPTGLSGVFAGERLHFRHALVQDAVLAAMPKGRRADLHERFAAGLGAQARHEPAVVGYHLEQAARLRMELRPRDAPPAIAAKAAAELERAGLEALALDDAAAAGQLLSRARELLPTGDVRRLGIEDAIERSRAPRVATEAVELQAGEELGGFVIEGVAGRGGMATVYRARDPQLERLVALKVIAPLLANDLSFRARFVRESRIAASIDHPGVIPVYGAGEDDGRLYIAMRYVDGGDLAALMRERGALPLADAVAIVAKVAGGLDAAHARGLVHRDVKPANALLEGGASDRVYLSDFGLSSENQAAGGLTKAGQWVGTVAYSAPEQVRGEAVDARADIYALGGLLYTLLTGSVPFPATSEAEVIAAHLHEPPPRASRLVATIPRGLDAVVARAMHKEPAHRYPSAGDLARAATAAARGDRLPLDHGSVAMGAAAPRADTPRDRVSKAASHARRPSMAVLLGAGGIVLVVAAAVVIAGLRAFGSPATQGNPAGSLKGAPIRLPRSPDRLALTRSSLWVLTHDGTSLARFDTDSRRVQNVAEPFVLRGDDQFPDVTADESGAWVAHSVTALDGVDRVADSRGRQPAHLAFASVSTVAATRGVLWAASDPAGTRKGTLLRIGAAKFRVTGRVSGLGRGASAIAVTPTGVWIALRRDGVVARIDPRTLRILARVRVGKGPMRLAAVDNAVWVLNGGDRTLSRIDTERNQTSGAPISLGKDLDDISAAGGSLWVAAADRTVTRLDARTGATIGSPVTVPAIPIALAADTRGVWVGTAGENALRRIDTP